MRNGQNKRMRNRNRKGHNPATRVYESNGPDVKIRGTAAHIAEKYVQLARDAQSAGDYIAAENYNQHAEHYFRIIAASQEQFRQSQPYSRGDDNRDDGDDEMDDSGFGSDAPAMARETPQPFIGREPQPFEERANAAEDDSAIERLPSFITGGQPQSGGGTNDDQPRSGGSESRFPRRRRRHPGPRTAGGNGASDDVAVPGAE